MSNWALSHRFFGPAEADASPSLWILLAASGCLEHSRRSGQISIWSPRTEGCTTGTSEEDGRLELIILGLVECGIVAAAGRETHTHTHTEVEEDRQLSVQCPSIFPRLKTGTELVLIPDIWIWSVLYLSLELQQQIPWFLHSEVRSVSILDLEDIEHEHTLKLKLESLIYWYSLLVQLLKVKSEVKTELDGFII